VSCRPWTSGPKELLRHATEHLRLGSPFDHRIALISADNAVEIILRTFLRLPARARTETGPTRSEVERACESFGALLDLTEKHAIGLAQDVSLADIEYYHRLRNALYHEGNGITVEPAKVTAYVSLATFLLERLLDEPFDDAATPGNAQCDFDFAWSYLDYFLRLLHRHLCKGLPDYEEGGELCEVARDFANNEQVDHSVAVEVAHLWRVRNDIVKSGEHVDSGRLRAVAAQMMILAGALRDQAEEFGLVPGQARPDV
jgi:hypothetical protein